MVKVGKLKVFSWFCGKFRPTLGPIWYFTIIPQIVMCAMMVGVLVSMCISVPEESKFKYVLTCLIGLEALAYWTLCFSEPGIPKVIL